MPTKDESSTPILRDDQNDEENSQTFNDDELNTAFEFGGGCCNPSSTCHRFIALLLICLTGFAGLFCDGNIAALQNYFMKDLDMSIPQYMLMSSINAWPNVVIPLIGGFLIDRVFGIRFGTILYVFIVMIGQLAVAFGVILNAYWMILFGRFIFGIGFVSLDIAQRNYAVLWFKDKELNMVFGIIVSFGQMGITISFMMMESLYKYINQWYTGSVCLGIVMLISFGTCVMSFIGAVLLGLLDKRAQRILQRNDNPSGEIAKLSDVKTFKAEFWMLTAVVVSSDVGVSSFMALSKMFFMQKYEFSAEEANYINSMMFVISTICCTLFGYFIGKTGRNIYWMLMSILVLITSHSLLAFTFVSPYICMFTLGVSYLMLYSTSVPLIVHTVAAYQLGTAYGTSSSILCLISSVVSLFIGKILDHGGYFSLEIFFISCLGVALTVTVVMWIYNENKNGIMNMTPHERDLHSASDTDCAELIANRVAD